MEILTTTLTPFDFVRGRVDAIQSTVKCDDQNLLRVTFLAEGDIERLKIPVRGTPRQADRLWQHTCFEAFVRAEGDPAYLEFNFSPSGEWSAYEFRSYRDGGPIDDDGLDPKIAVVQGAEKLDLSAVIRLDRLPGLTPSRKLRLGLCAVIEDSAGRLSYWALKHVPGKPDFHHADSFALELSCPGQ